MIARLPQIVLLCSFVWLAACDGDKPADGESKDAGKSDKAEAAKPAVANEESPFEAPSADWPTLALSKVDDAVDGLAFSISLPVDKLKKEVKPSDGTFSGYVTWNGASFVDPSFTVQIDSLPPADLAAAARGVKMHPQPAEVTRQEELEGGGFLVSYIETSKQFVSVRAWRTSPSTNKVVRVTLQMRNSKPIANIDALRGWMETVAISFTVM
jgi:hypothetical protein